MLPVVAYHGTTTKALRSIQADGELRAPKGNYGRPQWYMLAADQGSAAHHARGYEGVPVVLEFQLPAPPKDLPARKRWAGAPYLWPPHALSWEGRPTQWWALRTPVSLRFLRRVHIVDLTGTGPRLDFGVFSAASRQRRRK